MKEYQNGWNQSLDLGPKAPELSEDLEWVLQSGQSDPNLVAEGLLHTYYAPVYRLCLALEGDPQRADQLLVQIFAKAVNQAYRYRPKTGIPIWFYTCLLQALPRPIRRERRAFLPVLLQVFDNLSVNQLADLFNLKASRVKARLDKLEKAPQTMLARAGLPPHITDNLQPGPSWRQTLQERFPAPDLDDDQVEALAAEIIAVAEKQNAIRRRWLLFQELALLLVVALAVAGLIIAADSLSPAPETPTPPPTLIVTQIVEKQVDPVIVAVPNASPAPTRYPTPSPVGPPLRLDPLTTDSSPLSIQERLRITEMFWETVWAETVTILYGPPGYLGPDRLLRSQFWLSADQARILSGPPEGPPNDLWIGNRGQLFAIQSGDSFTRLPELVATGSLKRPTMNALKLIFNPLQSLGSRPVGPRSWQIQIVGRDQVAGRSALVIELLDANGASSARLWLDTFTNFVLRHQQFREPGDPNPAIEIITTRIAYDAAFQNQSLFDFDNPYLGSFAFDTRGRPSRATPTLPRDTARRTAPQLAYNYPPPGFDPAGRRLSFLYPPDFDLYSPEVIVEVFAETYHLGSAAFANPWWMICERSPDGKRVAAASHPLLSQHAPPSIYWLDLTDLRPGARQAIPVANVSELAFAPDSRRLALLSKGNPRDNLYLADLETGDLRLLASVNEAHSLTWSPTGEHILLISEIRRLPGEEDFVLIDAATGQVNDSAIYDPASLPTGAPSLGQEYGSWYDNSARNGGLEACVAPSAQNPTP